MQCNVIQRFNLLLFDEFPTWMEYSIVKEAEYCLCFYLFKMDSKNMEKAQMLLLSKASVIEKENLREHVGGPNSTHNKLEQLSSFDE